MSSLIDTGSQETQTCAASDKTPGVCVGAWVGVSAYMYINTLSILFDST